MDTDARLIAIRYYGQSNRCLQRDMATLGTNPNAVIIYLPQLVVLMKPADSRTPHTWDRLQETPRHADAWYVHLLVGNMQLARQLAKLPQARPWLCFHRGTRNARPHIIRWKRFASPSSTQPPTQKG